MPHEVHHPVRVAGAALARSARRTLTISTARAGSRRLALAGIAAVVVLIGAMSAGARPVNAQDPPMLDAQEQQLLELINAYRRSLGLPDLELSPVLQQAARWKAEALAAGGMAVVGHDDVERSWMQRLADFGYPPNTFVGENLGFTNGVSLDGLMDAWKASPAHDENLRGDLWRYIGIAHVIGAGGMGYWVLNFGEVAGGAGVSSPEEPAGEG